MKTFNDAVSSVLANAQRISTEVSAQLASLEPDKYFNVAAYAKKLELEEGLDELFVATLVRTIVNNCNEFESKRGRNGGVGRVTEKKVAPVAVVEAAKELEVQVTQESSDEPEEVGVQDLSDELANTDSQTSDDEWLDQMAANS